MLLSEGQMSDFKGAALMIDALPKTKALLGDKGYDANWFRAALAARNIPHIDVLPIQGINVADILRRNRLVLTKAAVEALEARFA